MTKESLDFLIKTAIDNPYSKDLLLARKEYQKYSGEIFEDDKSYEDRMALFLEWYIFERIDLSKEQTILETIISNSKEVPASILTNIKQFINNIHGLFIVKKIRDTSVRVLNLFDDKKYDVYEPSSKLYFSKDNIFEGRLLPYEESYFFTGNFCFHPDGTKKYIKSEIKKILTRQKSNEKELKLKKTTMSKEFKVLNNTAVSIKKLQEKVITINNEKEKTKIKKKIDGLEPIKSIQEQKCHMLEKEITIFTDTKVHRQGKLDKILLMQKLSYMRLLFERSRNIDLKNIYKN